MIFQTLPQMRLWRLHICLILNFHKVHRTSRPRFIVIFFWYSWKINFILPKIINLNVLIWDVANIFLVLQQEICSKQCPLSQMETREADTKALVELMCALKKKVIVFNNFPFLIVVQCLYYLGIIFSMFTSNFISFDILVIWNSSLHCKRFACKTPNISHVISVSFIYFAISVL